MTLHFLLFSSGTTFYYKIKNIIFDFLFVGAHSHIRGLGLDDALEARQVCL